jgi:hypothetical protein
MTPNFDDPGRGWAKKTHRPQGRRRTDHKRDETSALARTGPPRMGIAAKSLVIVSQGRTDPLETWVVGVVSLKA